MARASGIRPRHSRGCRNSDRPDCGCRKSWEASIWDPRKRTKVRKTFRSLAEAKSWRTDAAKLVKDGKLSAGAGRQTVRQAGDRLVAGARDGSIRKKRGARYKPSVIREYQRCLEKYVYPELGRVRLAELRRRDVQALVDQLVSRGLSGSRVHAIVMPLRTIVRRAIEDDEVAVNATANLRLPDADGTRDRVASPEEAQLLLDALEHDRALWATAVYAGLRRGELRALRWDNIDDAVSVITVEHGWDDVEGEIDPKSKKGARTVPVAGVLRKLLLEQKAATGRRGPDLVFGRTPADPFTPSAVRKRAAKAWASRFVCGCTVDRKAEPVLDENGERVCPEHGAYLLRPIGLHECRHTYVSLMHDAGFSLERIGDYVGHSSAWMVDRYRHLLEGHEAETAARFDAYLERWSGAHGGAQGSVVDLETARVQGETGS